MHGFLSSRHSTKSIAFNDEFLGFDTRHSADHGISVFHDLFPDDHVTALGID
jgi:hypothetical protein